MPKASPVLRRIAAGLLAAAMLLLPAFGMAEMITGTVLAVSDNGRQVTLRLTDTSAPRTLLVVATGTLPPCARPGNIIRVWGTFVPGGKRFTATDIRGPGHGHRPDPTGVRYRLERSLDRGYRSVRPPHAGGRGRMRRP
ncbi:MAG TPA: hypothetical protein ENI89_07650 [Desulfobulbus sp.]|nr:hypothetical protein [Desulfobulbus sp.]